MKQTTRPQQAYKIPIDGDWDLEDLYQFPRTYEQVYSLLYSLHSHKSHSVQDRIAKAYSAFPWLGGYSTVNFYNHLKYTTPKNQRPKVLSLKYSSPGWIELSVIIGVAVAIERVVKALSSTIREANSTYNEIHKGLSERRLLRIKEQRELIKLAKKHQEFIQQSSETMAELLHIEDTQNIHDKTGNKLISLKIMLSLYRRFRTLAAFQNQKKTKL